MQLTELIESYERDSKRRFESINQLLDHYQNKYITEEIDLLAYREIYNFLDKQGATSSHEYVYEGKRS
ncbi:YppF family protein [Virgibacillus ndiopensis]|uniref:YppF family protein n=1 Tax=Virgibacillus ndiopensis TaxID=2004408 RepID=UPI000C073971|nr:YppF family protein [Virgibacillus ndiopensis]